MATDTTYAPFNFRDEHIATRKDWCTYVILKTTLSRQKPMQTEGKTAHNRETVERTDEFLAQIHARLDAALRHQ